MVRTNRKTTTTAALGHLNLNELHESSKYFVRLPPVYRAVLLGASPASQHLCVRTPVRVLLQCLLRGQLHDACEGSGRCSRCRVGRKPDIFLCCLVALCSPLVLFYYSLAFVFSL